jgi:uncharacterized protein (TIGR04222 family)
MRTCRTGVALVFAALVSVSAMPHASSATFGAEEISQFDSDVTIEPSGALLVHETIVYDFGTEPGLHHGIFRVIPVRFPYPQKSGYDRVTPLTVVSVHASNGASAQYAVEEDGDNDRIKIGDPDKTITGVHTYDITYRVRGALNGFTDHDELVWNVTGNDWPVFVLSPNAAVHVPATVTGVACTSGPYGSTLPCDSAVANGDAATFTAKMLGPFSGMTVTVGFPKGAVATTKLILEEQFDFASAFRVTANTGGIAIGLLVLLVGAALALIWWVGRDRRARGSAVDVAFAKGDVPDERVPLVGHDETPVEFAPPDGLRPGQVGTLVDFKANPLDVTATLVDLAVRGYLTIEEVEHEEHHRVHDWTLTRQDKADTDLLTYERLLLTGLFPDGDPVTVSELRDKFAARMRKVQDALTQDATDRGWFAKHSSLFRASFVGLGLVVIAAGIMLAIALATLTHAGLIAIPVIIAGIVLLIGARFVPRRTAQGYAVLRHVDGFRRFIDESEKERARFAEQKNLFSEYLPYAIVFGATKKWARAFEGLDGEPPDTSSWYPQHGAFNALLFSSAIEGFTVTTSGTLASVPASTSGSSGFSGGGFSGGGFGGGGGGSW